MFFGCVGFSPCLFSSFSEYFSQSWTSGDVCDAASLHLTPIWPVWLSLALNFARLHVVNCEIIWRVPLSEGWSTHGWRSLVPQGAHYQARSFTWDQTRIKWFSEALTAVSRAWFAAFASVVIVDYMNAVWREYFTLPHLMYLRSYISQQWFLSYYFFC